MAGPARVSGLLSLAVAALLVIAGCGPAPGRASQSESGTVAAQSPALDKALRAGRHRADAPGASAAVVRNGELVWAGASGQAVTGERAMTPETLVPVASTTKTAVAAMVLRLAEQGRVDLDEPIGDAARGLPATGRITPRMLLRHRSGLADYFGDGAVERIARRDPEHPWTRAEVLSHVPGLDFDPGSRYAYSNTGYVALGGVIEAAAGAPLEDVFQREVAEPAGMDRSTFAYDADREPEFAHPHRLGRRGRPVDLWRNDVIRSDYWGPVWTDGGLASTAIDLARLGNAAVVGDLLDPSTRRAAIPRRKGAYGLGIDRFGAFGTRWLGHSGVYEGFETENWTDPRTGITVAVAVNVSEPGDSRSASYWSWWKVTRQALRESSRLWDEKGRLGPSSSL